jgi:hypothetical protein
VGVRVLLLRDCRVRCLCCRRTYWFIKLVLPTPLSPRMMTWYPHQYLSPSHISSCAIRTFNRIFLRDAIVELLCGGWC